MRITEHPVIKFDDKKQTISFSFNGKTLSGIKGEPIIREYRLPIRGEFYLGYIIHWAE